jgi:cytochrome c-type biogenesis protein CcmE
MKKSHVFGIVVIAIAIGIIVSTAGDASSYVTFQEASVMAKDGSSKEIHVVGKLKKDPLGKIVGMEYHPQVDPNYFRFIMLDNNNEEHAVVLLKPKPQDFDRSEQIVVNTGSAVMFVLLSVNCLLFTVH